MALATVPYTHLRKHWFDLISLDKTSYGADGSDGGRSQETNAPLLTFLRLRSQRSKFKRRGVANSAHCSFENCLVRPEVCPLVNAKQLVCLGQMLEALSHDLFCAPARG